MYFTLSGSTENVFQTNMNFESYGKLQKLRGRGPIFPLPRGFRRPQGNFMQIASLTSQLHFKQQKIQVVCKGGLGGKYLFFVSSRSVKKRGFSFLSLYKSVFIFQFLDVKMYNYGKQNIIVNFIIKKLKKTQFPQKV